MLPAQRAVGFRTCSADKFFGKSYPRSVGRLDEELKLVRSEDGPKLPNAALIRENIFYISSNATKYLKYASLPSPLQNFIAIY